MDDLGPVFRNQNLSSLQKEEPQIPTNRLSDTIDRKMYYANHNPYDDVPDTIKQENKHQSLSLSGKNSIVFSSKHPEEYIRESKILQPENVNDTSISPETHNDGSGGPNEGDFSISSG